MHCRYILLSTVINESKTEEYEIILQGIERWKKCKLLGSHTFKTLNNVLAAEKSATQSKSELSMHIIIASVFLYNSELWTLTKKLENTVNTFQRRHLRKILRIHWPKKITNIELCTKTKTEEWSITIQRRRLNWLGHRMRLHPETPVRLALAEYLRKGKRPKGRSRRTWMELIKHDMNAIVI